MLIKIHRGANEIGGTCIQLSTDKTTILLDLGLPLKKESKDPDLSGLKIDGVLISHPHADHFGLIDTLDPSVPVYIGELGRRLIDATRVLLRKEQYKNDFRFFSAWKPFRIGDFKITPYLVDHSATDSYAFWLKLRVSEYSIAVISADMAERQSYMRTLSVIRRKILTFSLWKAVCLAEIMGIFQQKSR